MKLNEAQESAVTFVSGPCLVLAGAGSGKTRVITNKIAHLVRNCDMPARYIAAVTFTNKAAREMKERVAQTLGKPEARGLKVSTFHTMGLTIIKAHVKDLGLKPGFSLFDDKDSFALLNDLTSDTLDGAAAFDKGDEIVVYATADDGEASSSPVASAKLLVLNSPPTAPELEPDPAEYSAGDEVHCKVATASTDADGDSLTYTFSWTLNGAATSDVAKTVYTGDTFVGDWGEDDVLVCTANVSDGADSATQTMKVILGAKVLLVYDALSGSGVGVKAALEAAGHTVTWSDDPEFLYDGSNPAPDTFDVVFFINGSAGSSDMPSAGQKAIVDFVKAGGGFVYNEPAMSEVSKGHYGVLSTLFVGTSTSSTTGGTLAWTTVGVHPVLDGISSSFSTPKCHVQKATTKTGATLVLKAGSWEGAAVMTFGSGRSVGFYHFGGNSSDCDSTSEITDLYSNAVFWAAGRG